MNIFLTPELENFIRQKVASGMYPSASEVIREGLQLLKERDMLRQTKLQELRKEIQRGIESSTAEPFDIEEIINGAKTEFKRDRV